MTPDLRVRGSAETEERAAPAAMKNGDLAASFRRAFAGLWFALSTQRNARIHLAAGTLVISLSVMLGATTLELLALVLAAGLVMVAELINTAVESAVDLAAPHIHPLAGAAKDVAAAAVLLAAIAAVAVGVLVLGPHLLAAVR